MARSKFLIIALIPFTLAVFMTYAYLYLSPLPYTWSTSNINDLYGIATCGNYAVLSYINISNMQFWRFIIVDLSNGHVMRIYPPVATNATMNTEGIALPQIGVSCANEALNIIYTCVNKSGIVNNYVPGICLLRINESNGRIMSYYFFSPIYSYKGIIHGLLIGASSLIFINNNSIYAISMGSVFNSSSTNNVTLTWYLVKLIISENGSLRLSWETPVALGLGGIYISGAFGRTSPMLSVVDNHVSLLYSGYGNNGSYNALLLINDSDGSVIYRENITDIVSDYIYYSAVVNNVLVYPCSGSSLCGIDLMSGKPRTGFPINNLGGVVYNVNDYGVVLSQGNHGVNLTVIDNNGMIIRRIVIPIDLYVELGGHCSSLSPMDKGIAVLVVYPCSVSYGVYGYKELVAIVNVTSGSVIREFIKPLKLPIINSPSPDSILPYITPVFLVNDKYFLYFFDDSLFIVSESQLINDSWYYIFFDNIYTVITLWIIIAIIIVITMITYRQKR
ncbi:hypothetical protein VMUT_1608 [Vulcanisaeta moutnovskia 768-28]|uniref:Uncharacterized protein n=1 Tax=Vulcanisaeta moutnovskia (strain 768-28) TaxID=985053 RepID=F0QU26_VULM7|nr:hypothetical protein [Vulcanisaeta moutnovskia]ADY01812.1 hypothetical protein VMUT_1608 [Vulcanisaeta moutnovskia 768-28]